MKLFSKSQPAGKTMLAIVRDPQLAQSIDRLGASMPSVSTTVKTSDDPVANGGRLVNGSADVVIVEADMAHPQAIEALQRLSRYVGASGSLVAIIRNGSTASVRQLFRLGLDDVLELPVSDNELKSSLGTLMSQPRRRAKPTRAGRIISVQNAGGGAGASTVAINLAHNLASRKKAHSGADVRVLLVDFDPQFGSLAAAFDVEIKTSLLDLIKAGDRLDGSFLDSTSHSVRPGLDLLTAPREILPLSALSKEFCNRLLDAATQHYDYIILDHAQNWGAQTQPALSRSDAIILTLRPCIEHAERAQAVMQGLDDIDVERGRVLVVANGTQGLAHKERLSRIADVLNRPIETLPFAEKIHRTARERGKVLAEVGGAKAQVKAVSAIADQTLAIINSAISDDQSGQAGSPVDTASDRAASQIRG